VEPRKLLGVELAVPEELLRSLHDIALSSTLAICERKG